MAEEKKTTKSTDTATKKATSSTSKATNRTTSKAFSQPNLTKSSKSKDAAREEKEALRKEVLELYNRNQNSRATSINKSNFTEASEYSADANIEEPVEVHDTPSTQMSDDIDREEAYKTDSIGANQHIDISATSTEHIDNPLTPDDIGLTSQYNQGSQYSKIKESKIIHKNQHSGEKFRKLCSYLFSREGLFYLLGFISLIGVIIILLVS